MRDFNTTGPVQPEWHYCIPPLERINLPEVLALIARRRYFVLHAPRQTGKTSALLALRDLLNESGDYRCVYANVEAGQAARHDVAAAMEAILGQLRKRGRSTTSLPGPPLAELVPDSIRDSGAHSTLSDVLTRWSEADPLPLVLLLDEIDALVGDTLISVLRQLRSHHDTRPGHFPQSVILCGVRDVRDYRIHTGDGKEIITGGSAFNVKAKSLRLGDFTKAQVAALLGQHTADTGQEFAPEAIDAVWTQTRGQPWLVNALAQEMCFEYVGKPREIGRAVSSEDVFAAREALVRRRETHLDQLAGKLMEPCVRRVVEPLLSGADGDYAARDLEYVRDLGLVTVDPSPHVANPIYGEVIPRELTWALGKEIGHEPAWYVTPDGALDLDKLLGAFQDFFRENSEHWIRRAQYTEAGPQLVLQAFLHRIVNARGRIEREYALGSRRVDLLVVWPKPRGGTDRFVIECKLLRGGRSETIRKGLAQTAAYMDLCGTGEGHLVVFDMREGRSWADRIYREDRERDGLRITVWGA